MAEYIIRGGELNGTRVDLRDDVTEFHHPYYDIDEDGAWTGEGFTEVYKPSGETDEVTGRAVLIIADKRALVAGE